WLPEEEEMAWLSEKYPNSFDKLYRPRYEQWRKMDEAGNRFYNNALPQLCNCCQIPMAYTEPGDPTTICYRESTYKGERYHFCSDGCKDIFDNEPEKFSQSWLPVHQIFQGNCGGADLGDVLKWYRINVGADNMDQNVSPEQALWNKWQADRGKVAAE
ncbi:MAG: YHS domain-containing protein, partial [Gammaproteobacteria bacterium]|nr:YHS domain-containing protein [Gammaproteobacteria bacterium]